MVRLVLSDDAAFIREIARNIAVKAGFEVVGEACDGEEAVSLTLKTKPDVVLMDLIMPKKNGIDASREILEQLPGTKIIAFSTADQELMVMRALEVGCCSFLNKPFTSEELVKVIKESVK